MLRSIFVRFSFGIQIFAVLALCCFGCSTALDRTYNKRHIPPPQPRPGHRVSTKVKTPATQNPYRIKGVQYKPLASARGFVQTGIASWYGRKFHNRKTANGETYNMYAMTAAHKTLPLGTWVRVQNLENNRQIVVRINDRGPFVYGRIIDLSYAGAKKIGIVGKGTAKVRITALGRATSFSAKTKAPVSFRPVDYWKGNFTVQVGAFQIKKNALKYRHRLSKTNKNVHIVSFRDGRGVFYRVRIGRFTSLKDAMRFREKLMACGFDNAFTIAR